MTDRTGLGKIRRKDRVQGVVDQGDAMAPVAVYTAGDVQVVPLKKCHAVLAGSIVFQLVGQDAVLSHLPFVSVAIAAQEDQFLFGGLPFEPCPG